MSEREPIKKNLKRVGLELDDEQLSQVPIPQTSNDEVLDEQWGIKPVVGKRPKLKLGTFWTDKY